MTFRSPPFPKWASTGRRSPTSTWTRSFPCSDEHHQAPAVRARGHRRAWRYRPGRARAGWLRAAQQLPGRRVRRVQDQGAGRPVRPGHRDVHGAVRAGRGRGLRPDVHGRPAVGGARHRVRRQRRAAPAVPAADRCPVHRERPDYADPAHRGSPAAPARRAAALLARPVRPAGRRHRRGVAALLLHRQRPPPPCPAGRPPFWRGGTPPGRTSQWVHDQLELGQRVAVDGPYGTFVGDPATDTPVVCLAAGSGLAPILALTDAALRRGFPHQVTLLFSAATDADELDIGLLRWWEQRYRNFRFLITHTRGPADDRPTKRLPQLVPELFARLSGTSVFIAGSPHFVDGCAAAPRACVSVPAPTLVLGPPPPPPPRGFGRRGPPAAHRKLRGPAPARGRGLAL